MDTLSHLLLLILAGSGVTYILMYGSILATPRRLLAQRTDSISQKLIELIQCPICLGFWVGVLMELVLKANLVALTPRPFYALVSLFLAGALVSCSSNILDRWAQK